jgi:SP family arabinose:H+ symporter-like MFS transporter
MNPIEQHRPHLPIIVYLCIASALGGFLWGFDAIVISGTTDAVKGQFTLSSTMEGFFVSSGLLGAIIGSAMAGLMADRFGRVRNLILAAVLMWLSALGSAFAPNVELLVLARWLGGLGVGISAMICPLYISEISPAHLRGRLVTLFQFAITAGIMLALFSNLGITRWVDSSGSSLESGSFLKWFIVDQTWRSMFASELIPGTLFLLLAIFLPESPRWLVSAGYHERAKRVLDRIFINGADAEFKSICETISKEKAEKQSFLAVFAIKYRKPLLLGMALAVFAQVSGINTVFYYGTSLLKEAGLEDDGAFSGMAVIGFFNMMFTIVAVLYIDKFGRRKLLQIGTIGVIVCLLGIGMTFNSDNMNILIVFICCFVAFFAFSLGPIKFVFASEIFPANVRAHAVSLVILTMWTTDWLVAQLVPHLRDTFGTSTMFIIFACCVAPQIFLIWKLMPETAGRSLEEIEDTYYS